MKSLNCSQLSFQSLTTCEIYTKKNLLVVRANNPVHWKILSYCFKVFYVHYSSFQGQRILPVGQVNASLFTETFQHHTPTFWYKTIPKEECDNTSQHRTLLVSYHYANTPINYF